MQGFPLRCRTSSSTRASALSPNRLEQRGVACRGWLGRGGGGEGGKVRGAYGRDEHGVGHRAKRIWKEGEYGGECGCVDVGDMRRHPPAIGLHLAWIHLRPSLAPTRHVNPQRILGCPDHPMLFKPQQGVKIKLQSFKMGSIF